MSLWGTSAVVFLQKGRVSSLIPRIFGYLVLWRQLLSETLLKSMSGVEPFDLFVSATIVYCPGMYSVNRG